MKPHLVVAIVVSLLSLAEPGVAQETDQRYGEMFSSIDAGAFVGDDPDDLIYGSSPSTRSWAA